VDGAKTYDLAQFHFHTPREHRVNEEIYMMELHFVFEAAGKSSAIQSGNCYIRT
jgi:carbonic anhydrase